MHFSESVRFLKKRVNTMIQTILGYRRRRKLETVCFHFLSKVEGKANHIEKKKKKKVGIEMWQSLELSTRKYGRNQLQMNKKIAITVQELMDKVCLITMICSFSSSHDQMSFGRVPCLRMGKFTSLFSVTLNP